MTTLPADLAATHSDLVASIDLIDAPIVVVEVVAGAGVQLRGVNPAFVSRAGLPAPPVIGQPVGLAFDRELAGAITAGAIQAHWSGASSTSVPRDGGRLSCRHVPGTARVVVAWLAGDEVGSTPQAAPPTPADGHDQLLEQSPAMLLALERSGRIAYVSDGWLAQFGYAREDVIGEPICRFLDAGAWPRVRREVLAGLTRSGGVHELPLACVNRAGGSVDVLLSAVAHRHGARRLTSICLLPADATTPRTAAHRLASAVAAANEGLWEYDPERGTLHLSPQARAIVGATVPALPIALETWTRRLHPDDRARFSRGLERHLRGRSAQFRCECRVADAGDWRWIDCRARVIERDRDGRPRWLAGLLADVSERKQRELESERRSFQDPLTGLANRLKLLDDLAGACARVRRSGRRVALLYLDLDGFKPINDRLGHACGDRLLIQLASRLRTAARETDTVARLGGDEFALVAEEARDTNAHALLAERLLGATDAPFLLDRRPLRVSLSIGVALYPDGTASGGALLADADRALYAAKAAGGRTWRMAGRIRGAEI